MELRSGPLKDGREVVSRDYAVGKPLNSLSDKPVVYAAIAEAILADGSTVYECNNCGYTAATTGSVTSHLAVHSSPKQEGSANYPPGFVERLVELVKERERSYSASPYADVARIINAGNVQYAYGGAWTGTRVRSVYRSYVLSRTGNDAPLIRIPQASKRSIAVTVATDELIQTVLDRVAEGLSEYFSANPLSGLTTAEIAELREKADKFEHLKRLIGSE